MRRALGPLVVVAMLLAGCSGSPSQKTEPVAPPGATSSPAPSSAGSADAPGQQADSVSLNDCIGMETGLPYANALGEFPVPNGWEPASTTNGMYVVKANICQRMSIGPFERGPVAFIFEAHRHHSQPAKCAEFEPDHDVASILLNVWVDDPEIAAYLTDLGMPVHYGVINLETVELPGVRAKTWTWNAEGAAESSVVVLHPNGETGRNPITERLVWTTMEGMNFLDLEEDVVLPQMSPFLTAHGRLAEPMWYAGVQIPFSGLVSVWDDGDLFGPIHRFGDSGCAQPRS